MRLVIKNLIQLCLRTLVFSIVLRHSNYNNRIISIEGTFFWDTLYIVFINTFYKIDKQKCGFLSELGNWVFCRRGFCRRGFCHVEVLSWIRVISPLYNFARYISLRGALWFLLQSRSWSCYSHGYILALASDSIPWWYVKDPHITKLLNLITLHIIRIPSQNLPASHPPIKVVLFWWQSICDHWHCTLLPSPQKARFNLYVPH
jgi:hypothetical protein